MPQSMFHKRKGIRGQATRTAPRYTTVIPNQQAQNAPFYYTAGPVFTEPAMAAIFHSKLSKPWQVVCGYAYPTFRQFQVLQPRPLWAPKMVGLDGIGIQQGQFAIYPASDDLGNYDPAYYAQISEGL